MNRWLTHGKVVNAIKQLYLKIESKDNKTFQKYYMHKRTRH